MHGAVHVERGTTHRHVGDAVERAGHELDERRCSRCGLRRGLGDQVIGVDVADARNVTPVLDDETVLPLVAGGVSLEPRAIGVVDGLLAEILVHEAGLAALGERAVDGVVAPHDQVHGGVAGRVGTACGDHVLRVVRSREGRVARSEAEELLGIRAGVAVEQGRRHRLVHRLKEGGVLGQPELGGVAVEHRQILVDLGASLKHAASLVDLRGHALAVGDALVECAPVHGRETSTDHDALAGGQIALLEDAVLKDLVALREQLGDDRDPAIRIGSLRPVGERQV